MIEIEIYTDGSCNQAAKTGGWAYILLQDKIIKSKNSGSEIMTTNNKCEMLAVINAFVELDTMELPDLFTVSIYCDSAYVVNAFADNWIGLWMNNGWLTSDKKPVLNKDLWERLIYFIKKYKAAFVQIRRRSNDYAVQVDNMAKKPLN